MSKMLAATENSDIKAVCDAGEELRCRITAWTGTHYFTSHTGLPQLALCLQVSVFVSCKTGIVVVGTPTLLIAARHQGGCLMRMIDTGMQN